MSKLTQELVDNINAYMDEGYSQRAACNEAGVPESTWRSWRDRGKLKEFQGEDEAYSDEVDHLLPLLTIPDELIQNTEDNVGDLEKDCNSKDVHIASLAKRLRNAQKTNNQLRKINNGSIDQTQHFKEMVNAVEVASSKVAINKSLRKRPDNVNRRKLATAEILFSDFQIGKVGQYYNSKLAEKAISKYGSLIMEELSSNEFNFERIIFASLGDTVEDHLKHGVQSASSTDSGLAEQMANALEYIWKYVIEPLGSLNIPMDIVCIAGNHGSSNHKGMDMYKAGLFSYDYPIYKALQGFCKAAGWDHIKFIIPEGVFAYLDIYGRTTVYEHGYFNTCTEKSLTDQKAKRGQQLKRHVEYFRCGDMHHVCDYNNGQEVVNGAFFGVDNEGVEYSGILGFNSVPAQKMMIHTREDSIGRNTIKRNINLQVADGY